MKYFSVTDIPFQCKPLCQISKYPEQLIAISTWRRIRHGSVPLLAFHWNETVVLIKLSSLATLKGVKMTILKKLSFWRNCHHWLHWKLSKWHFWRIFLSLAALKVVKMTTFSAGSDENFIKMTIFQFQPNNTMNIFHGIYCIKVFCIIPTWITRQWLRAGLQYLHC